MEVRGTLLTPSRSLPCGVGGGRSCHRTERKANSNHGQQDERHSYEKCQYVEFKKRVAKMDELREAKGGARSN